MRKSNVARGEVEQVIPNPDPSWDADIEKRICAAVSRCGLKGRRAQKIERWVWNALVEQVRRRGAPLCLGVWLKRVAGRKLAKLIRKEKLARERGDPITHSLTHSLRESVVGRHQGHRGVRASVGSAQSVVAPSAESPRARSDGRADRAHELDVEWLL